MRLYLLKNEASQGLSSLDSRFSFYFYLLAPPHLAQASSCLPHLQPTPGHPLLTPGAAAFSLLPTTSWLLQHPFQAGRWSLLNP